MPLFVNNQEIAAETILQEMERMRPDYEKTFSTMEIEARENQLLDWARDNCIERTLILQHAQADTRPIPAKEVNEAYEKLKNKYSNEQAFYKAMGATEKDVPALMSKLEEQLRVERLIADLTEHIDSPTPSEVQQYYEEHQDEFIIPEQVHAAHIVKHTDKGQDVKKAEKEIGEIQSALQSGRSFEECAGQNSDCPESGGDLGWFPRGHMVQEFEDVVFSMQPGDVSDVFKTPFGFHIAKLFEKRAASPRPLEQVGQEITDKLTENRKNASIEQFVDSMKKDAAISFSMDAILQTALDKRVFQARDRSHFKKPLTDILVKPSGPDCNMACEYCFYLKKEALFNETKQHRMSDDTLRKMIQQAMVQSDATITFGWQGGEPTLMGLEFFEKAVDYQHLFGRGKQVGNGFQTNGLLLNPAWAEFLKKNQFLVGLSIDGPEHIHDHYRKKRDGSGSWKQVYENGTMLLEKGVEVNALSVVNDYSVRYPEEIYNFHKETGFSYMQFIACVEKPANDEPETASFSVDPQQYGAFLCTLFDLWKKDFRNSQPTTSVRFFDSLFHSYVGRTPPDCSLQRECGVYIAVEHNGDVYSCDFFVDPEWKLGNIHHDRLIDMLNSQKQGAFGKQKSHLAGTCRSCEWLTYCRGGCPKDRLHNPRNTNLSFFCESYKLFFHHAHRDFLYLADQWKAHNTPQNRHTQSGNPTATPPAGQTGRNDPCPCGSGKKFKKCCGRKK